MKHKVVGAISRKFHVPQTSQSIVIVEAKSLRAKEIAMLLSHCNWAIYETTSSTIIYLYTVGKMLSSHPCWHCLGSSWFHPLPFTYGVHELTWFLYVYMFTCLDVRLVLGESFM